MDGLQVMPASPVTANVATLEDGDALTPTRVAVEPISSIGRNPTELDTMTR
jgi:hypothetical protein